MLLPLYVNMVRRNDNQIAATQDDYLESVEWGLQ
jgi:hypothetical protein